MIILGIETSCDETSAAVIEGGRGNVISKSNVTSTSLELHRKTGGIIPENAAREQIKYILPVIEQALNDAFGKKTRGTRLPFGALAKWGDTFDTLRYIDAIALTYGPGLIGSLLVGVETAKTISFALDKPIIPVNHMVGHIYANFIRENPKFETRNSKLKPRPYNLVPDIEFPAIALVVSGGHTDLLLMRQHGDFKLLGGTRDDAAGEAFDKIARLLGLPYPGGPEIEKAAQNGNPNRFHFPRPMIGSANFDFSFSGLKTAVLHETEKFKNLDSQTISDLAWATQDAIVDVLVKKTLKAAEKYNAKSILISGGVAANQKLRETLELKANSQKLLAKIFAPPKSLCTDNAAMIASAAYFNKQIVAWDKVTADPELYFS